MMDVFVEKTETEIKIIMRVQNKQMPEIVQVSQWPKYISFTSRFSAFNVKPQPSKQIVKILLNLNRGERGIIVAKTPNNPFVLISNNFLENRQVTVVHHDYPQQAFRSETLGSNWRTIRQINSSFDIIKFLFKMKTISCTNYRAKM